LRVSPEPKGRLAKSGSQLRFCVQKHLARAVHYDFRLEHNGALLSWAIPKGPSLNPKDKRFAARTEDHPLMYADFEGVIPEGYGAGIMMLWDQGTWTPESPDVDKSLAEGELKFRLDGVKLKGSWVLVRTRHSEAGKEQWLLLKHRDEWSGDLDVVTFAPQSVKTHGDFADILRAHGVPPAWKRHLPVKSGESSDLIRSAVAEASSATNPKPRAKKSARTAQAKAPTIALTFGNKRPKLSNLDKPLYPGGFTKGQVIDYYTRIAPHILPHLAGRATTLKRYPDGVEGKFFFEKRCPSHAPPWVQTVRVASSDGSNPINYCVIDDISTLVWVANLAALELHVPLARAAISPDTPTAMLFDLDPGPPAGLKECAEVAVRLKRILDSQKLRSFVKFSGGKGMHVVVPLNHPEATFDQTKTFSRAAALTLERDDRKLIISSQTRSLREGKVLIDWSQNDRAKTTVCVYSLRAREQPTVSAPVDWEEIQKSSTKLANRTAAEVLKDPQDWFAEVLTLRQELPEY
jgi:bifunctional non-homologous end joining protein LigD